MSDLRSLPIPDGLEGERLDAALARMFGLSRTRAAELAADGRVRVDGAEAGKSDRVRGGSWLEIELPPAADPVAVKAEAVEGMVIVHDDDDIVVIDKPVGRRGAPEPGLDRARPSSAAWPRPGTGSRPPAPPSGRASCTGWTSGPAA